VNLTEIIETEPLPKESATSSIRVFTYAQFAMVALFVFVIVFTLFRFTQVKEIFTYLSVHSVPSITKASAINSSIQQLATLTVKLTNSQSKTDASLTVQQFAVVAEQLIDTIDANRQEVSFIAKELSTIIVESNELKTLVEVQLAQKRQLQKSKSDVYTAIFSLITNQNIDSQHNEIIVNLQRILSFAVDIENQQHLHKLRETEQELLLKMQHLRNNMVGSKPIIAEQLKSIEKQLVGEDSIISQKISLLRTQARSRGRSSFVVHLIENLASNLQYQTQIINKATQKRAESGIKMLTNSYEVSVVSSVFAFLASVFMIYYLYKRIVARLIRLTNEVEIKTTTSTTQMKVNNITVEGNDEITLLSKTFCQYLDKVRAQEGYLRKLSNQDSLTQIPNRRSFDKHMEQTFESAKVSKHMVSLILIDVDFFKQYNDKYGHSLGDICLQEVAAKISQIATENNDFCARYGGEEFAYVASNKTNLEAKAISDSLRQGIQDLAIEHSISKISNVVTASVGCASVTILSEADDLTASELIELADTQLYTAKNNGRNKCCYI